MNTINSTNIIAFVFGLIQHLLIIESNAALVLKAQAGIRIFAPLRALSKEKLVVIVVLY